PDRGEPVVQRLDDERRLLRGEDRHRVRLEGEHDRLPAELAGARYGGAQDGLMTEVDAVEVAERQHHPRELVAPAREVADDAHWRRTYTVPLGAFEESAIGEPRRVARDRAANFPGRSASDARA